MAEKKKAVAVRAAIVLGGFALLGVLGYGWIRLAQYIRRHIQEELP